MYCTRRMSQYSFFKVMLGDFTHQLHIPPAFVLHYNDILPQKLLLETYHGECWDVKLKKKKNELFLCEGWTVFVKDNSLEFGDFLVFRPFGGSKFNVRIYGKHCCEKVEGIFERKKTDQCMSCKRKGNYRNAYVGLADEHQLCDSKDQYKADNEEEREGEFLGDDWCKTSASPRKGVFNKGKELAKCNPKKNLSSTRSSFGTKSNKLSKLKLKSNDACRIKKKDNKCVSWIGQSTVKRSKVTLNEMKKRKIERGIIPLADSKSTDEEIELSSSQDAESTDEETELSSNKDAESTDEEDQSHGFEQGNLDLLHHDYQKAESSPRLGTKYLNLSGRRRKPATMQETGRSNAANGFKSKYPFFTIRLHSTYVNGGFMYIPMDFADTYLPKESTNVCILDSSERAWPAQYSYKKYFTNRWERCRACLSKGWKALVVANKLREGYICAFELIEVENMKLKLSILKKGG